METDAEVAGVMELAEKALKISVISRLHVPQKVEENMETMREEPGARRSERGPFLSWSG